MKNERAKAGHKETTNDLVRAIRNEGIFDASAQKAYSEYLKTLTDVEAATYEEIKGEEPTVDIVDLDKEISTDEDAGSPESDPAVQAVLRKVNSPRFIQSLKTVIEAQAKEDGGRLKRDMRGAVKVMANITKQLNTPEKIKVAKDVFDARVQEPGGFARAIKERNPFALATALELSNQTIQSVETLVENTLALDKPSNLQLSKGLGRLAASVDTVFLAAAFGATQAGTTKVIGAGIRNMGGAYDELLALGDQIKFNVPGIYDASSGLGQELLALGENALSAGIALGIAMGIIKYAKHFYQKTAQKNRVGNSILATMAVAPVIAGYKHPIKFIAGASFLVAAAGAGSTSVTRSLMTVGGAPEAAKLAEEKLKPIRSVTESAIKNANDAVSKTTSDYSRLFLLAEDKGPAAFSQIDSDLAQKNGWTFQTPAHTGQGPLWRDKAYFMIGGKLASSAAAQPSAAQTPQPVAKGKKSKNVPPAAVAPQQLPATAFSPERQTEIDKVLTELCVSHGFSPEDTKKVLEGKFAAYATIRAYSPLKTPMDHIARADKRATDTINGLKNEQAWETVLRDFSVIFATTGTEITDASRNITVANSELTSAYAGLNATVSKELTQEFKDSMTKLGLPAGDFALLFPEIVKAAGGTDVSPESKQQTGLIEHTPYPWEFSEDDWKHLSAVLGTPFETAEQRDWYIAKANLLYGIIDFGSTIPVAAFGIWLARRLSEKKKESLPELDKFKHQVAREIAQVVNQRIRSALKIAGGVDVMHTTPDAVVERMHALSEQQVAMLKPERKRTWVESRKVALGRLFRTQAPESDERQYAFYDWLFDGVNKMGRETSPQEAGAVLLTKLYPEFSELYVGLCKLEQSGEKGLDGVKLRNQSSALRLAKKLVAEEIELAVGKTAAVELALEQIYKHSDNHPIIEQYKGRAFSKVLDGTNEVILHDIEAEHFVIATRMEQVRTHALQRLADCLSASRNIELREAAEVVVGGTVYKTPMTGAKDPRQVVDRLKADLGDEAADIVEEAQELTWRALFNTDVKDTSFVNMQLTEINKKAVAAMRQMSLTESVRNPLFSLPNIRPEFSFAFSEALHRPTVMVSVIDTRTGLSLSQVAYNGYVPDPKQSGSDISDHIVNWYKETGQYELSARALHTQATDELISLRQKLSANLAGGGEQIDVFEMSGKMNEQDYTDIARYNLLTRIVSRQQIALGSLSRSRALRRVQLNPFFEEDSALIGGSGVTEDANVLSQKFVRIVTSLTAMPEGQRPHAVYNLSTGDLVFSRPNSSEVKLVSLQDFKRVEDLELPLDSAV